MSLAKPNPAQLLALVLWKHHRTFGVTITAADIDAYEREAAAGQAVLAIHGRDTSIDLKIVTTIEAARLAKDDPA